MSRRVNDALSAAADVVTAAAEPAPRNKGGRPPGNKREVANRLTVCLDRARDEALKAIAADHERSVHSLVIEAIDRLIGRARAQTWRETP
jgi:hypothetical protein